MNIATFITLGVVARSPESSIKRAIFALVVLCVFIVSPRSLAEDLLSPIIGTVDTPITTPSDAPEPSASPTVANSPTPEPTPTVVALSVQAKLNAPHSTAPSATVSESSTPSASPTPLPPHAISDQNIQIEVPTTVSIDPRAHSVFLPRLQVGKVDTLLVCGYSTATAVYFGANLPGVESIGSGTPFFRITGPAQLVMATLNGEMGARVLSTSRSVTSSVLSLSFIALSKPSLDQVLCNNGSPSNNRTISFRALNMDLNMVKDPVRLK